MKTRLHNKDVLSDLDMEFLGYAVYFSMMSNDEGVLLYGNKKAVTSFNKLRINMGISHHKWTKIKKSLNEKHVIRNLKLAENNYLIMNPMIIRSGDFIWTKDVFDLFEDYIKENSSELEYLKISSNWYEVNHQINCRDFDGMGYNVSGIYRLYKNDEIVYIGKSVDIKVRMITHRKEKDVDYFDFTILNNESDKNIYELYYIDKYKPLYNKDCMENDTSTIELKDLTFSNKISLTKQCK